MAHRRQNPFPCPVCDAITMVTESRVRPGAFRRVRRCANRSCTGRLTTYEVVATGFSHGELSVVPSAMLRELMSIATRLGEHVQDLDVADEHPDDSRQDP